MVVGRSRTTSQYVADRATEWPITHHIRGWEWAITPIQRIFRDGTLQTVQARQGVDTPPIVLKLPHMQGLIWVWHGEPRESYPPLPLALFEGLESHLQHTFQTEWNTHYTRALQGLLDVSHLPFVHARTIGRGKLTLVNGPYTTLEADKLFVWISNQPDVGLPAIKPTQLPPPQRPPDLRLQFPNIWQLWLNEKSSQVVIAAPIDDAHTMLYVRFYQQLVTQPIIGRVFTYIGNLANRYIVHEDKAIIVSQHPKKAELDAGERFIPGDRPIALYLQQRQRLILEAETGANDPTPAQPHS